jgi:hypothetical protein
MSERLLEDLDSCSKMRRRASREKRKDQGLEDCGLKVDDGSWNGG